LDFRHVQIRTRCFATSFAAAVALMWPAVSFGQNASLAKVDSLIAAGQAQEARATLDEWKKENEPDAHSAYLTARLAPRAQDAEDAYLDVALNFSSSRYAAESLLRLGQARTAAGDAKQAAVYLQRLIADYPASEHRATAQEWLARTQAAVASAPQTKTPAPARAQAPAQTQAPARAPASAPAPVASARGRYAVQVGAFREITGARSVARQLEKAGFTDVRLVTIPANTLIRVRVGNFENSAGSAALALKLKAAGFPAAPVSGVQNEQPVRD
jgi:cell division protein FtsN